MLICHEGHLTGGSNLITALITTNVPDKDRQVERDQERRVLGYCFICLKGSDDKSQR